MRDAIIYNRNNPSIIFYECGNESISREHMVEMKKIRDQYDPFGGRACDKDTCCKRKHKCRKLRHKSVTYREGGIIVECIAHSGIAEHHAGDDSTHKVHYSNEYTGLDVSAHEFRGSVHGSVKVNLVSDLLLSFCGFLFCDCARVQFILNIEHLAVHAVQSETRAYFRNTSRTLCDNNHLNHNQDDEDDETHDYAVSRHNACEGLNH